MSAKTKQKVETIYKQICVPPEEIKRRTEAAFAILFEAVLESFKPESDGNINSDKNNKN